MKNHAPYTQFNQTRMVPVVVYLNNKEIHTNVGWDTEMWIERGEDWYGLMSSDLKDKKVRIITREAWLRAKRSFTDVERKAIMDKFPSICYGCANARRSASDENAELGYVGCSIPARLARQAKEDSDESEPRTDFISDAVELASGWVDLRSFPFGESSGVTTNMQLLTIGVKKCAEYRTK